MTLDEWKHHLWLGSRSTLFDMTPAQCTELLALLEGLINRKALVAFLRLPETRREIHAENTYLHDSDVMQVMHSIAMKIEQGGS